MDNQEDVYGADIKRRVYELSVNRKVPPILIDKIYQDHGPGVIVLGIAEKLLYGVISPGILKDDTPLEDIRKLPTLLEDIGKRVTDGLMARGESEKLADTRQLMLAYKAIRNVLEAYADMAETPQYQKLREHLKAMEHYADLGEGGVA